MPLSHLLKTGIISIGEPQLLSCPVCDLVPIDAEDTKSIRSEGACTSCVINFKHLYIDKWTSGWRPTIKEAREKMHI